MCIREKLVLGNSTAGCKFSNIFSIFLHFYFYLFIYLFILKAKNVRKTDTWSIT